MCKFEKTQALSRQGKRGGSRLGKMDEEAEAFEWKVQKDCWADCEFPSECNNNHMQEELNRRQIQALLVERDFSGGIHPDAECEEVEELEERWDYNGMVMGIEEWEAELQRQKVAEFEKQEQDLREMGSFVVAPQGIYTQSSSSSSSFSSSSPSIVSFPLSSHMSAEIDIVDMERRGLEGEAQMVDMSLGSISSSSSAYTTALEYDGEDFYGAEIANRKRKKSFQKIAQLTGLMLGVEPVERGHEEGKPKSPLKEEFTLIGEMCEKCDGDGGESWNREVAREIRELEHGGNLLRRRVGRGEVAEFGDEDEDGTV